MSGERKYGVCVYVRIHIHIIMEYYSATKNKNIFPFATTWMTLVGIMLNEISQVEKVSFYVVSLIHGI